MNTHSDFASRHIRPPGEKRREMLKSLGYETLEELIADIVPADIRMKAPLDLPAAKSEPEALGGTPFHPWKKQAPEILHRPGILRRHYSVRHPAQHSGKPRLVHGLYALSAGNRPGTAGNAHELPDHGGLPDGAAGSPMPPCWMKERPRRKPSPCAGTPVPKANTFFVADTCHPQTISVIRTPCRMAGRQHL